MAGAILVGIIAALVLAMVIATAVHLNSETLNVIETGSDIAAQNNVILKEAAEVILHTNNSTNIENKGQQTIKILEFRILDDDGNLLDTCYVNEDFRSGSKKILDPTNRCVLAYTHNDLSCLVNATACIIKYG